MSKLLTCDIFCAVVDNYGDIGVCWRLAKQLANEHGMAVRLWVDDLASFRRLCPEINPDLPAQQCHGVKVRHWEALFPEVEPAHMVIEAFACELPQSYVAAMAKQQHKPVWINLEYLSAEDWVAGCHRLPSPHPSLPLVKYFFFPGFTRQSGGLLLERDLIVRRDAFQRDPQAIAAFWQALGAPPPRPDEIRVSLFCYENPALPGLFAAWAMGSAPVCCLVPEGRVLPQVAGFFGQVSFDELRTNGVAAGDVFERGNLRVQVLPFVEQERYDELLWACDINFVRGEDSCVRAQWAAQPFVWHIYPQHDGVHMHKLRAFMDLYCAKLPPSATRALHELWEGWNGEPGQSASTSLGGPLENQVLSFRRRPESSVLNQLDTGLRRCDGLLEMPLGQAASTGSGRAASTSSGQAASTSSGQAASTGSGQAWDEFRAHRPVLRQHAHDWAQQLSGNNLALNLLDFFRQVGKIRAS